MRVPGGRAGAEVTDEAVYLAIALKNVGSGLAVLDRWDLHVDRQVGDQTHSDPDDFRRLRRDIYVPAGDLGFWQGTFRDTGDRQFAMAGDAINGSRHLTIDLLYGDHEGGQRMISRFTMTPDSSGQWITSVGRHWNLDRPDPR
ncbi:MAG TPA: hypothetical protein VNC61_02970 [Acidimicrobiales bacterium]|nr:hypothetical protein [Acidimicrobiales bacterium]